MPNATEANVKTGTGTLVGTTGLGNTAIGTNAGQAVTGSNPQGMSITLIGASAGKSVTTGAIMSFSAMPRGYRLRLD